MADKGWAIYISSAKNTMVPHRPELTILIPTSNNVLERHGYIDGSAS